MKLDRKNILNKMPPNLDQLAKDTGALRRRREIKSAEQVLWMVLIYSGLVSSLRETAALAASLGDFDINDTSVRYRIGNAVEFLTAILNHVLFGSAKILADKGIRRRICLQDAADGVVRIPAASVGFADGTVKIKEAELRPLAQGIPLKASSVTIDGIQFTGLMRDLGVTEHTVVHMDFHEGALTSVEGRLAALPVGAASTTSRSLSSQMVLMTEMV